MKEGLEKEFQSREFGEERLASSSEGDVVGRYNTKFCIVRTELSIYIVYGSI